MEPSAKSEWRTPDLVPLTGVRESAANKDITNDESTFTISALELRFGPAVS